MKRYQFFSGLNEDGVDTTLAEYKTWEVVNMGYAEEVGFWILLVVESPT